MLFKALRIQIRSYLDLVWWTVKDAFRPLPWSSITMVGGGFAALALQVNGVALTVLFARSLTSETPLSLGPIELHPRDSTGDLLVLSGGILVSMLLSTAVRYAARLAELRIRERYADRCWTRGVELVRGPRSAPPGPVPYHLNEVQRLVRADALLCSRFAVLLLQSSVSSGKLLVACVTLLIVNPLLTIGILAMGTVFGAAAYRVNLRSARVSMEFEDSINDARAETRELLLDAGAPFHPRTDEPLTPESMPAKRRYLALYGLRLRTSDEGEAIGNLLLAMVLSATVLGIGLGSDDWSQAAMFLIALPYALLAFRELMRTTTSLNRFYPMVRRYRAFVDAFVESPEATDTPRELVVGFHRHADRRASPVPRVVLHPGDIAVAETPFTPDRHTTNWFIAAISESRDARPWIDRVVPLTSRAPLDRSRMADLGWSSTDLQTLRELLVAEGRPQQLDDAFAAGDHLPRPDATTRPVMRLLIWVVIAARLAPDALILLDGRDVSRLSADGLEAVRRHLAAHIVIVIVPPARPPLCLPGETPALTVAAVGLQRIDPLAAWGLSEGGGVDAADDSIDDEDDSSLDGM